MKQSYDMPPYNYASVSFAGASFPHQLPSFFYLSSYGSTVIINVATVCGCSRDNDHSLLHFTRALSRMLQRIDLTAEHLDQLTLNYRSDASELRPRILQHLAVLTKDQTLTITQSLLIVTPPLKGYDVSYTYKARAVQAVVALLQPKPLEHSLRQYWHSH